MRSSDNSSLSTRSHVFCDSQDLSKVDVLYKVSGEGDGQSGGLGPWL